MQSSTRCSPAAAPSTAAAPPPRPATVGHPHRPLDLGGRSPGQPGQPGEPSTLAPSSGRITIDSVVQKTAFTLGLLVLSAAVTWFLIGDITAPNDAEAEAAMGKAQTLALIGVFGGFALSMVNSFKRIISPPLVLAYAVLQGMAIGAISLIFETLYPGVVMGAWSAPSPPSSAP